MRIHSLKTVDFGPHRKREDDIDAAVVGLLGPNGSGKSTLLNAIQFALTGELNDPLDTYIRGRGVNFEDLQAIETADGGTVDSIEKPDIAKAAQVEMTFSMHGQSGKIIRRITPTTSKRTLEWDGEIITKAADVDAALKDIVGADKKALSEIVFPQQGELDNLLFGRQSEREELFIKLLLLTHMAKVADMADNRARLIKQEIANLDSQKDQLKDMIDEQTKAVFTAEEDFRKCTSWAPELTIYRHIRALDRDISDLSSRLSTESSRVTELEGQLSCIYLKVTVDHNQKSVEVAAPGHITSLIEAAEKDRETMVSARDQQIAAKNAADQKVILEQQLQQSEEAYKSLEQERDGLQEEIDRANRDGRSASNLNTFISALETAARTNEELSRSQVALEEANSVVEDAKVKLPGVEKDVVQLNEKLAAAVDEGALARVKYEALKAHHEHGGDSACPVCDGELGEVDETTVAKALEALEVHRKRYEFISSELKTAEQLAYQLRNTVMNRGADITSLTETVKKAHEVLANTPEGNIDEIRHEKNQLEAKMNRVHQISQQGNLELYQRSVEQARDGLEKLKSAGVFNDSILSSATSAIQSIDNYVANMRVIGSEAVQAKTQLETTRQSMADNTTRLAQKLDEHTGYMNQRSEKLVELMSRERESAERVMEERTQAYTAGESRLSSERKQLATLKERLQHLEDRERVDAARASVADQLIRIKEAFQRRGLPITYVQYRFNQLVELANRNLMSLDANFSIQCDPREMVSLTFRRTDDASDSIFAMNKLSGGQRVRLSIAFLLAIQQLIIPDLGLLVLDEPSMHLNDEGVESLADLLQSLGQQLVSADAQVIVCDHNHRLDRSFQKTIRLT